MALSATISVREESIESSTLTSGWSGRSRQGRPQDQFGSVAAGRDPDGAGRLLAQFARCCKPCIDIVERRAQCFDHSETSAAEFGWLVASLACISRINGNRAPLYRLHYKSIAAGNNSSFYCRLHNHSRCVECISNQPPGTEYISAYLGHCIQGPVFHYYLPCIRQLQLV